MVDKYIVILKFKEGGKRMSFGQALILIRNEKKSKQKDQNSKKQYIYLAQNINYLNIISNKRSICNYKNIRNKVLVFAERVKRKMDLFVSQVDVLADNWKVVG